jgi:hypothetical protein
MTCGKPRFNKNYEWELIRFCSLSGCNVIGGASKLLKFFERTYKPSSIISYADRRRSLGEIYGVLGFEHSHNTDPNYFYYKGNEIKTRYECQKHKLVSFLGGFDINKSEQQNMRDGGYRKVYDSGCGVYIKKYK